MSNPTTPFNWQMPTNTDLVTDLPADFEVFGQAVASSMADLLGGTTGQILSKATNADMDFTWINNDQGDITGITATSPLTGGGTSGEITVGIQASSTTQSGAVQLTDSTSSTSTTTAATPNSVKTSYDLAAAAVPKSTVTTAGDVIYATGSGAVTRLGIGTAGQVLTVNGGATAPSWAAPSGGQTLLSTTSLTGAAVTISTISAAYKHLFIVVKGVYLATAGNVGMTLNGDTGSKYTYNQIVKDDASVGGGYNNAFTSMPGFRGCPNTAATPANLANAQISIPNYTATDQVSIYTNAGGRVGTTNAGVSTMVQTATYDCSAAISSITFTPDYNFSGGTVYIYGVN
jgi:hypothetical protein